MQYTIENNALSISVESHGAQIKSVKVDGKERAWQNENGAWKDTSPLLFPICGHFGVTVDGKTYPMPAHGLANKNEFTLVNKTQSALTLVFSSNENTKTAYPFDFKFFVTYEIADKKLTVKYTVQNMGKTPLYFACGGHDSFALAKDVDKYQLVFEKAETLVHYAHDDGGYLTGDTTCYGENTRSLILPKGFLSEGRTLIFKGVQSRKVSLQTLTGETLATLTFEGFENLLLWRATADSRYICIEPWTNLPDYANAEEQELSQKSGVYAVGVGEEKTLIREIEYV